MGQGSGILFRHNIFHYTKKMSGDSIPSANDVFGNFTSIEDFDVVSFGLSANILHVILQRRFGVVLTAYPIRYYSLLITITTDECVR